MVNPKQTGQTQNKSETEHLITEINEDEEIHTENAKSQQQGKNPNKKEYSQRNNPTPNQKETEHQDIDIKEDGSGLFPRKKTEASESKDTTSRNSSPITTTRKIFNGAPNSKEKNSNELNTFFINIRSLRNELEELELFIDNEKLDIICLCEHWLHQDIIKYYGIEHFSLVNNYCRTQSNHGGVMIYVNSKFKTKKLPIIDFLSVDIHCEVIAIEVKTINIRVLCMYRSPSGDPGIFLQILNHILNLLKTHKPIFIYGDFNINIKGNCNLTNEFCDTVSSFGCELLVYESTRITQNSETCIDNCITDVRKASKITLVNSYMSDHIGLKNKYTLDSKFKIKDLHH
ncbi:hypothetical protein JTB14_022485 [Gonioctena quinquepunctata]|nr:hypothetical protein JTB14_022485 [Gonioctena quinquepunctata]